VRLGGNAVPAMRRVLSLLPIVLLLATAAGCGSDDDGGAAGEDAAGTVIPETGEDVGSGSQNLNVGLNQLNRSGQQGSAIVTAEEGEQTRVTIQLDGEADAPQPAHIHEGTCDNLNPEPAYPLENVEEGRSETLLDVRFEELREGEYAINVHRSEDDPGTYVACGNLGDDTGG
jgi:CHRD domain